MGFGLLFVGYIITANIIFKKYTDIIAYAVMFAAVSKLSPYGKYFRMSKTLLYGMLALGAAWFAFAIVSLFGVFDEAVVDIVEFYFEFISIAYYAFYNYALFMAIERISEETEIPVLVTRAKRQRNLTLAFHVIYLISSATPFFPLFVPILVVVWIVLTCFNASVIYSCYMWITLEGDDGMERRRSRFAFVNRIADALDRFEDSIARRRGEEENERLRAKIEQKKKRK